MYIRTPKRYRKPGRRHNLLNWRRLLIWIIAPIGIFVGLGIYGNHDRYSEDIRQLVNNLVGDAESFINETGVSPAATTTPDPADDLLVADDAWRRGAIQEAVEIYQEAAQFAPNDVLVHYRLALGYIMQGDSEAALVAADNAVTAWPYNPDAWSIRAMALDRLDRPREAIASAQRALALVPDSLVTAEPLMAVSRARALAFLAEAYLLLNQTDRALEAVEAALILNPDSFEAYQVRGRIYQEASYDFDAALADFQAAYDLAPNMVYVAIWLARLESWYQNYDQVIAIYQDILDHNSNNTLALYDFANYYLSVEGDPAEATQYLDRCINADPNNADCHYLLGHARLRQQDAINAQISFQMAYSLDPQDGYYIYYLADSYIRLGSCDQAIPYLQTGYSIALQEQNQTLIDLFEESLQECRMPVQSETTPKAQATAPGS